MARRVNGVALVWTAAASEARRRFGWKQHPGLFQAPCAAWESGVALHLPPQSKATLSVALGAVVGTGFHWTELPTVSNVEPMMNRIGPPAWRLVETLSLGLLLQATGLPRSSAGTVLGIEGTHFLVNGKPCFLLGCSYYAGLGASEEFVRKDLDDAHRYGFNWLRVWATWAAFGNDVSAVSTNGRPREPYLGRLKWLVAECDRRGMVVDITLTRGRESRSGPAGGWVADLASHERAVETLVTALKAHRNWYLDLANEHDVRDGRFVPTAEVKALRELARRLDPARLVTCSFGGHDLDEQELRENSISVGLDFLTPHRPRTAGSPRQTEAQTREALAALARLGHPVPIHYQEPFRRGYGDWQPAAEDFLTDLRGAIAGGAAGWCFHNGSQNGAPGDQPRRSFDLREKRLFDQLDSEERKFIVRAHQAVDGAGISPEQKPSDAKPPPK